MTPVNYFIRVQVTNRQPPKKRARTQMGSFWFRDGFRRELFLVYMRRNLISSRHFEGNSLKKKLSNDDVGSIPDHDCSQHASNTAEVVSKSVMQCNGAVTVIPVPRVISDLSARLGSPPIRHNVKVGPLRKKIKLKIMNESKCNGVIHWGLNAIAAFASERKLKIPRFSVLA